MRLSQYLANSSLWIDEAAVARNIIDRPLFALFQGLDYAQVAPVGFLVIEKGLVHLFGTSEYALRGFPLASGLIALPLFWSVARRIVTGWAVAFAVGLFALGTPFIYFSAQVKQYSSDAAAAILVLLLATELRARGLTMTRAWLAGLAGAALQWFSQPVMFVLVGVGIALVVVVWRERDRQAARALVIMGGLWAASAAGVVWLAMRHLTESDRGYFRWFWADGFMPMPPRNLTDVVWIFNKLTWAFGAFGSGVGRTHGGLNYRWSALFMVVTLVGLWSLWRTRKDVALFLGLPVLIVGLLSALQLYPFTARLFLFLQPSLLLATAAGASQIATLRTKRWSMLALAALGVLGGSPIYATATGLPPYWTEHTRPLLEYLRPRLESRDAVWVYYAAGQAFYYYAPRFDLPRHQVTMGTCSVGNPRGYLRQLDAFRGRERVWLLITHAQRLGTETELMLSYLDDIGRRLDARTIAGSGGRASEEALLYLYDLSDRDRLRAASADGYPIPRGVVSLPTGPYDCYGVGLPEALPNK